MAEGSRIEYPTASFARKLLFDFSDFVSLEDIAVLQVAELLQRDAALVALCHFLYIVLKAAQRRHLVIGDDDTVTDDTDIGGAHHLAIT